MMVRDAAKTTDHPIADLALFSMLTSSPLAAGLGFPHYYDCQKASSLEEGIFSIHYFFNLYNII
jgi:hypothetical protein